MAHYRGNAGPRGVVNGLDGAENPPHEAPNGEAGASAHAAARGASGGACLDVPQQNGNPTPAISERHQRAVTFLDNKWNKVIVKYHNERDSEETKESTVEWYRPKTPNPNMEGFVKFDLEDLRASRMRRRHRDGN